MTALVLKKEIREAVKMINHLSQLPRSTLDNIKTRVLTLEDEIEFTRCYLEIEHIKEIQSLFKGKCIIPLINGKRLKSSRGYRYELQKLLDKAR